MGATTFVKTITTEKSAVEAFRDLRAAALYEHGHGGYTGTIAEKQEYIMITWTRMPVTEAAALANKLLDQDDDRVSDKWGPAGCIPINTPDNKNGWLFFGWASE